MQTRSAVALAFVALWHAGTSVGAQDWSARYPPAPECRATLTTSPGTIDSLRALGTGSVTVRFRRFGTTEPVPGGSIHVVPVDSAMTWPGIASYSPDTASVRSLGARQAGRYLLGVRHGLRRRIDTVDVRSGGMDTLTIPVETFWDSYRNVHNCRPRGFRRDGESACAGDGGERLAAFARRLGSERGRLYRAMPAFDVAAVTLVREEAVCERAALAYGRPDDPPRRVFVVRLGEGGYMVYDPYEPLEVGEWDAYLVFDPGWRRLFGIAG